MNPKKRRIVNGRGPVPPPRLLSIEKRSSAFGRVTAVLRPPLFGSQHDELMRDDLEYHSDSFVGQSPSDSPGPMKEPARGRSLVATSSEADISGHPIWVSESPPDRTLEESIPPTVRGSVTSAVDMVTQPQAIKACTLPDVEDTTILVTKVSGPVPAKGPAIPPHEESISPVVKDLITVPTLPQPHRHHPNQRFFLSPFQRPALLDTLVQRLQKKRNLVFSWRVTDQRLAEQGTLPARYRVEDLSPSQISEYIRSGGKSIDAPPDLTKDKVFFFPPSGCGLAYCCAGVIPV